MEGSAGCEQSSHKHGYTARGPEGSSAKHGTEADWTAHLLSTKMVPFLLKMPYVSRRWRALAAHVIRVQASQICP